jgi:hypothetical protein
VSKLLGFSDVVDLTEKQRGIPLFTYNTVPISYTPLMIYDLPNPQQSNISELVFVTGLIGSAESMDAVISCSGILVSDET